MKFKNGYIKTVGQGHTKENGNHIFEKRHSFQAGNWFPD
jgi:hypothetical protein